MKGFISAETAKWTQGPVCLKLQSEVNVDLCIQKVSVRSSVFGLEIEAPSQSPGDLDLAGEKKIFALA